MATINKGTPCLFITTVTPKRRGHEYSLLDHHSNPLPVFSERFFLQKVN